MNSRAYIFGGLAGTLVVIAFVLVLSTTNQTNEPVVEPTPVPLETPIVSRPPPEIDEPLIVVTTPTTNAVITSPTTLSGTARGYWFFEASFPVELRDESGNVLATSVAQADGEWMTENFVQFSSTMSWATTTATSGVLIFKKDNPSGLPENDDSLEIPVYLK